VLPYLMIIFSGSS